MIGPTSLDDMIGRTSLDDMIGRTSLDDMIGPTSLDDMIGDWGLGDCGHRLGSLGCVIAGEASQYWLDKSAILRKRFMIQVVPTVSPLQNHVF